jgi:hypothetical protein
MSTYPMNALFPKNSLTAFVPRSVLAPLVRLKSAVAMDKQKAVEAGIEDLVLMARI